MPATAEASAAWAATSHPELGSARSSCPHISAIPASPPASPAGAATARARRTVETTRCATQEASSTHTRRASGARLACHPVPRPPTATACTDQSYHTPPAAPRPRAGAGHEGRRRYGESCAGSADERAVERLVDQAAAEEQQAAGLDADGVRRRARRDLDGPRVEWHRRVRRAADRK